MRPERTDEELQRLSKHLAYEIEMACWQARYIEWRLIDSMAHLFTYDALPARNALIEAFALHVRSLLDFLYRPNPKRKTDAVAWDYVPDWQPPPKGKLLDRVNERVGKEIAHLSYKRNTIAEDAKDWPFMQIRGELVRVLRAFVERVEDHQVDASFRQRVERAFSAPPPQSHTHAVTIDPASTTHMHDIFNAAGTATTMLPPPYQGD